MTKTIKDIWYAITSPEHYRNFMNYERKNIMLYVLVLVFLAEIISMGIPAVEFLADGGFEAMLEDEIPDFTASSEDGFWIEEPVEIDEFNFLIKANSDIVHEDITDLNGQYGSYDYVVVVDKEQVHVKMPERQEVTARFDEMIDFSFSKEDVMSAVPFMYLAAVWIIMMLLISDFIYYFITALIVSWGAGIVASFMGLRLGNRKIFKMSVYAGTFSYLLSMVQVFTGKSIPNFAFFSFIITMGYMFFALKEYKESGIEELPPEQFGNREG